MNKIRVGALGHTLAGSGEPGDRTGGFYRATARSARRLAKLPKLPLDPEGIILSLGSDGEGLG